jgi:hypothetical protein
LGATFLATDGKLIERKVSVIDPNGNLVGNTRRRITDNTTTALTLDSAISGLVVGSTYAYAVGGPAFDWQSLYTNFDKPFIKKRMRFINIQIRPGSNNISIIANAYIDYALRAARLVSLPAGTSLWDEFLWDEGLWDVIVRISERFRVSQTGDAVMLRLRQFIPDQPVTILKVGFSAEVLTEKLS